MARTSVELIPAIQAALSLVTLSGPAGSAYALAKNAKLVFHGTSTPEEEVGNQARGRTAQLVMESIGQFRGYIGPPPYTMSAILALRVSYPFFQDSGAASAAMMDDYTVIRELLNDGERETSLVQQIRSGLTVPASLQNISLVDEEVATSENFMDGQNPYKFFLQVLRFRVLFTNVAKVE